MSNEPLSIFPRARIEQLEERVKILTDQLELERKTSEKHLEWANKYKDQFVDVMKEYSEKCNEIRNIILKSRKESDSFRKLLENSSDRINSLEASNHKLSIENFELKTQLNL